jgi:HEAT repeat protein
MGLRSRTGDARSLSNAVVNALRLAALFLPAALLFAAVWRSTGRPQILLGVGALFQALCCTILLSIARARSQPAGPSVIALHLIALAWTWLAAGPAGDWYYPFAQSLLLTVPLGLLALQALSDSGGPTLRRARVLAHKLAGRQDWPRDLFACRNLPEVKALREALHLDATPALDLLNHPKMAVRIAALAALEFRTQWRHGQADFVLSVGRQAEEPALRAAVVNALANVEDRILIESLADHLSDPSRRVRLAAAEALLWDSEHRWPWIRQAVRCALSNPALQDDGPLQTNGQLLPPEAVADLQAWAGEKGILGLRAAQVLSAHYHHFLSEKTDESLVQDIQRQLSDFRAPPALRLELAKLFDQSGKWTVPLLERLLDPANPASLRLLAAEKLLQQGEHPGAVAALHDIARLPNREIALATAVVVQHCLGIDLGLPLGQPLPGLQSRQAAEITRRVLNWAEQEQAGLMGTSQRV